MDANTMIENVKFKLHAVKSGINAVYVIMNNIKGQKDLVVL